MPGCSVPLCTNHNRKGVRMFRFPASPGRRQLWLAQVKRDGWEPTSASRICSVTKAFLALLNTTKRSAACSGLKLLSSQVTTEAMRVTLPSTLDIIEYLFGLGVHYILTAKLNRDPLERQFRLVRSFGGDESQPTVVNFTQIFRLLSLYTFIKTALRRSVEGGPIAVLDQFNPFLRGDS
ncbi:uncharacterized protein LOC142775325 [Rhipicephalus microplus]|uniref:uncharacterized protein LOC142775325 n=1 Tax=Rhipicephalus microplus TaxID=6941 RepID=UPI003F6C7351